MILALADSFSVPLHAKGMDGRYYWCNSAFCEFVGLPRNRIIGATVFEIGIDEEVALLWNQKDNEVYDNPKLQEYLYQRTLDSGKIYSYVVKKQPIYDIDGRMCGISSAIIDITNQIKAETNFELVFNLVPIPIIIVDTETGKILRFNKAWELLLEYSSDELKDKTIFDFRPDLNGSCCLNRINTDDPVSIKIDLKTKSGRIIKGTGLAVSLFDNNKKLCLSTVII